MRQRKQPTKNQRSKKKEFNKIITGTTYFSFATSFLRATSKAPKRTQTQRVLCPHRGDSIEVGRTDYPLPLPFFSVWRQKLTTTTISNFHTSFGKRFYGIGFSILVENVVALFNRIQMSRLWKIELQRRRKNRLHRTLNLIVLILFSN